MKKIIYACICALAVGCAFKFLHAKQIDNIVTEVVNESGNTIYIEKLVNGKLQGEPLHVRPHSTIDLGDKGILTAGETLYFHIGDRSRPLQYAHSQFPYKYKIVAKPYNPSLAKMPATGQVPGQPQLQAEEVK